MQLVLNKRSFSLFEVISAIVIFSLVLLGMASIFVSSNRLLLHSRERIIGSELWKFFIDPLQEYVRQDTWNQPGNLLNTCDPMVDDCTTPTQALNNRDFTTTYKITNVSGMDELRRVTATISWDEPSF